MSLVAVALAALAAVLVVPARGSPLRAAPTGQGGWFRARRGPALVAGCAATGGVLVATVDGLRLVLALIALAVTLMTAQLVRRARRARAAERRRARVVDVAEALVGELRAGRPAIAALESCARLWPELDPVAGAARVDADIPAALRRLAELPGAEGLADVASAWQVSERSGAGLAKALSQVCASARARQAARHLVRGELASAQATARLVAVLPLASLGMSAGIGGDPWHFLLDTAPGLGCLALGALLGFAGLLWIDRIAVAVLRG